MQLRPSAPSPARRPHLRTPPASGRAPRGWRARAGGQMLALGVLLLGLAAFGLRLAIHAGGAVAWAAMLLLPGASACGGYWLGRLSRTRTAPDLNDRD